MQSVWQKHKYINRKFKNAEKNYSQIPKLKTQKLKFEIHKYKSKKLQIQQIDVPSWDAECWAQAFASFHFFHTSAKTSISTNTEKNTKVTNIDMFFEELCIFINSCHVIIQHKIRKHLYDIHYIHSHLYCTGLDATLPLATLPEFQQTHDVESVTWVIFQLSEKFNWFQSKKYSSYKLNTPGLLCLWRWQNIIYK